MIIFKIPKNKILHASILDIILIFMVPYLYPNHLSNRYPYTYTIDTQLLLVETDPRTYIQLPAPTINAFKITGRGHATH